MVCSCANKMTVSVFSVPVFFVIFRETVEVAIIISVLLAFLKQTLDGPSRDVIVYKRLRNQIWWGAGSGLVICLIISGAIVGVFYGLGKDRWSNIEYYWEGSFAVFAAIIITIMGGALLRVSRLQDKWRVKLAKALEENPIKFGKNKSLKKWCEKYAMFVLPCITVLREGLEAVVFIAGVSFSAPATSIPLAAVVGLFAGCAVGWFLYKGGATSKLQYFLVISTCILYLVAAGLFSRAVWYFQAQDWNNAVGSDAAELGAGAGSYDIDQSVWHVNFGNPELNGGGGWGIFNAILGWTNSATYGSVISYNLYWLVVMTGFFLARYKEVKGYFPGTKSWSENRALEQKVKQQVKQPQENTKSSNSPSSSQVFESIDPSEKVVEAMCAMPARTISE